MQGDDLQAAWTASPGGRSLWCVGGGDCRAAESSIPGRKGVEGGELSRTKFECIRGGGEENGNETTAAKEQRVLMPAES